MPKFLCTAPYPGTQIRGLGLLAPGSVVNLPKSYRPRASLVPQDPAAHKMVADFNTAGAAEVALWNKEHPKETPRVFKPVVHRRHFDPAEAEAQERSHIASGKPRLNAWTGGEPARREEGAAEVVSRPGLDITAKTARAPDEE